MEEKIYTEAEIERLVENRLREACFLIAQRLVEFCQDNSEMTCREALESIRELITEARESVH